MVYSFMFKTVTLVSTLLASLGVANAELETVKLTHPFGSTAEVSLFGAHVMAFRTVFDPDLDVLFMSNQSHLDGVNPIRGGIPVMFPNVASEAGLPEGGFARISNWTLASIEQAANEQSMSVAKFTLASSDATRKMWPVDFELEYDVKLGSAQLETTLQVRNTFSKEIEFNALLHDYIYVNDVRENGLYVAELQGVEYYDIIAQANKTEDRLMVGFESQTNSVYFNAPSKINAPVRGVNFDQTVFIERSGSISGAATQTDIVLWNPWAEGAKTMDDFGDEEYLKMATIAPGCVSKKQALPAGQTYTLHQTIDVQRYS
ncbi:hypothetical protein PRIC2_007976 [Phytophthora ramorum]